MGGKGNRPRNTKGQYVSWEQGGQSQMGDSAVDAQKNPELARKKQTVVIEIDSGSEYRVAPARGSRIASGSKDLAVRGKEPAVYAPSQGSDMEIDSDTSDDVDGLIDEVDEVFAEAKKKMRESGVADPVKVEECLDWVYEGILGPSVALKSKKGKDALRKKFGK